MYLNEPMLDSYLSSLEDGSRSTLEQKRTSNSSLGGKASIAGLGASGESGHATEERATLSDTPAARFERLLKLAHADREASAWIEVTNPDTDLLHVGTGAILELEAEVYVPDTIRALSPNGGMLGALDQLQEMAPFASSMGLKTDGLPSGPEVDTMRAFSSMLGRDMMVVGDLDDSDWRIAGKLTAAHQLGEIEGYVRLIGKVTAQWPLGRWKPLLALPGMNLLPREKRRELERTTPTEQQKMNYLEGPAYMLDLLAIYR